MALVRPRLPDERPQLLLLCARNVCPQRLPVRPRQFHQLVHMMLNVHFVQRLTNVPRRKLIRLRVDHLLFGGMRRCQESPAPRCPRLRALHLVHAPPRQRGYVRVRSTRDATRRIRPFRAKDDLRRVLRRNRESVLRRAHNRHQFIERAPDAVQLGVVQVSPVPA